MFVQDVLKHLPIISSNGDPTLPEDDPIPPFAYHYHCLLMSGVNHTLLEPVISCHNKTMIHNTFFQHFPLRPPYSVAISYYEDILHNDLNEILQQLVNSTAVTRVPALPSLQLCTSKRCWVWLFSRLDKVISLSLSSHSPFPSPWPSWWPPLDSLLFINIFLFQQIPKLDTVPHTRSHKWWTGVNIYKMQKNCTEIKGNGGKNSVSGLAGGVC